MRLSKFIASSGYASRRKADSLIENGLVIVNSEVCSDFSKDVDNSDEIIVESTKILIQNPKLWIFNKPRGYLCTSHDPEGRKTIYQILPESHSSLISVGRLDLNSQGLLLLTNNGELSRYYELPKNKIVRKYIVDFSGVLKINQIKSLEMGININRIKYGVIQAKVLRKLRQKFTLELILNEGKNREIRNISRHFSWNVLKLNRTQYGEFSLNKLKEGEVAEVKIPDDLLDYIESLHK